MWSFGLDRAGFTTLLWDVLRGLGYTEAPIYRGQQFREADFCTLRFDVAMTMPVHPYRADWPRREFYTLAADFDVGMEQTAFDALHFVCRLHREVLVGTPAALFPCATLDSAGWYTSMARAIQLAQEGRHLGDLMDYAIHLSRLYHRRGSEHRTTWREVVDTHRQDVANAAHADYTQQRRLQDRDQQLADRDA